VTVAPTSSAGAAAPALLNSVDSAVNHRAHRGGRERRFWRGRPETIDFAGSTKDFLSNNREPCLEKYLAGVF